MIALNTCFLYLYIDCAKDAGQASKGTNCMIWRPQRCCLECFVLNALRDLRMGLYNFCRVMFGCGLGVLASVAAVFFWRD